EPVADHMRTILDGHVVLSRELGDRGQLPAVDVLKSVSRLMDRLTTREEGGIAREARTLLAAHERSRDLISMGAYQPGHDATLDAAVRVLPGLETLVRQSPGEHVPRAQAISDLTRIVRRVAEEKA
ncbi:MAG: hypothetical protein ACTHMO_09030, partial [Rhodanobacteraceae bacterium]